MMPAMLEKTEVILIHYLMQVSVLGCRFNIEHSARLQRRARNRDGGAVANREVMFATIGALAAGYGGTL
jgi:hypothetical protein